MTGHESGAADRPASTEHLPEHTEPPRIQLPKHIGRFRTSTILLVLAFLGTVLLRGFFMSGEPENTGDTLGPAVSEVPTATRTAPASSTTTEPTTTEPTTTTGPATPTATSPTSPVIVIPPGLVPSGVELPPGIAVETTTTTAPPTSATP